MALALQGHNPSLSQSLDATNAIMEAVSYARPSTTTSPIQRIHTTDNHNEPFQSFSGEYTTISITQGDISRIQQRAETKQPQGILRPPSPDRGKKMIINGMKSFNQKVICEIHICIESQCIL
jgi:hypothetical protein